jgi:hypothetical protein
LRLCIPVGIDCSYPKSQYTSFLDLQFKSYEISKISAKVWACNQCSKFCPKLPNSAQRQNFEMPPKIKILVFSTCRGGTSVYFLCLDFQSKNFSYAFFIVKKRPLYVNFSIPPLWKLMVFSRFHTLCRHEILWTCT